MSISRRGFVVAVPFAIAGCTRSERPGASLSSPLIDASYVSMYAAIDNEPFPVPAIDLTQVSPEFLRREVPYRTSELPGTVVVDPNARYAYLVLENGRALRYGVGVGKQEAFNFRGDATVSRKAEWPGWRPTPDMIKREPDRYGPLKDGLPGGTGNPLGPRALYLYRDGQDTYYRLHGDRPRLLRIDTRAGHGAGKPMRQVIEEIADMWAFAARWTGLGA